MEMGMEAAGGWSETGGPWVKPQAAMKKIVWSETLVEGPVKFSGVVAPPADEQRTIPGHGDADGVEQSRPPGTYR